MTGTAAVRTKIDSIFPRCRLEHRQLHRESLLLQHYRDQLSIFFGLGIEPDGNDVFNFRQSLPSRKAGLGEQLLAFVRIVARIVGYIRIAKFQWRNMRVHFLRTNTNDRQNLLAIDSMTCRKTNSNVIEWRFVAAEVNILVL